MGFSTAYPALNPWQTGDTHSLFVEVGVNFACARYQIADHAHMAIQKEPHPPGIAAPSLASRYARHSAAGHQRTENQFGQHECSSKLL